MCKEKNPLRIVWTEVSASGSLAVELNRILTQSSPRLLSLCMCLESARFQEHLVEVFEMQVSTRLEVCLCKYEDMFPFSLREAELLFFLLLMQILGGARRFFLKSKG